MAKQVERLRGVALAGNVPPPDPPGSVPRSLDDDALAVAMATLEASGYVVRRIGWGNQDPHAGRWFPLQLDGQGQPSGCVARLVRDGGFERVITVAWPPPCSIDVPVMRMAPAAPDDLASFDPSPLRAERLRFIRTRRLGPAEFQYDEERATR